MGIAALQSEPHTRTSSPVNRPFLDTRSSSPNARERYRLDESRTHSKSQNPKARVGRERIDTFLTGHSTALVSTRQVSGEPTIAPNGGAVTHIQAISFQGLAHGSDRPGSVEARP